MRNAFTKIMTGSAVVGAALLVAACGHSDTAANTADTNMTDMNTMDSSAGMTNDISATDATANGPAMMADNGTMAAPADNGATPANQM